MQIFECVSCTITSHSASQTLLQATILAPIPMMFRYFAIHRATALIGQLLAYRPFEKSLASLAANRTIVSSRRTVTAYQTQFNAHHAVHDIPCGRNAHRRHILIATASIFGFNLIQTQKVVTGSIVHHFRIHCTLLSTTLQHTTLRYVPLRILCALMTENKFVSMEVLFDASTNPMCGHFSFAFILCNK